MKIKIKKKLLKESALVYVYAKKSGQEIYAEVQSYVTTTVAKIKSDKKNKKKTAQSAIDYLWQKARSEQAKSLASLKLLLDHPAGIGDHSTEDLYANLDEALSNLADAEDRLETLEKYFSPDT